MSIPGFKIEWLWCHIQKPQRLILYWKTPPGVEKCLLLVLKTPPSVEKCLLLVLKTPPGVEKCHLLNYLFWKRTTLVENELVILSLVNFRFWGKMSLCGFRSHSQLQASLHTWNLETLKPWNFVKCGDLQHTRLLDMWFFKDGLKQLSYWGKHVRGFWFCSISV